MAGIRYLLDENIAPAVRSQLLLHAPNSEVIRVGDEAAPPYGTPDGRLLEWIEEQGYILVSSDRRTMPNHLHNHLAQGKYVPGILLLKRRVVVRELIADLILIWRASALSEYQDHIRYLPLD